jgi:hypothetical protein
MFFYENRAVFRPFLRPGNAISALKFDIGSLIIHWCLPALISLHYIAITVLIADRLPPETDLI